jgi:hypothetical protein
LFLIVQPILTRPLALLFNLVIRTFNGKLSFYIRTVNCVEDQAGVKAYRIILGKITGFFISPGFYVIFASGPEMLISVGVVL